MFKIVFLLFILFGAYGIAVILLRRLTQTTKQLAELREQMARNDSRLSEQMRAMHLEQEKLQAKLEAENDREDVKM